MSIKNVITHFIRDEVKPKKEPGDDLIISFTKDHLRELSKSCAQGWLLEMIEKSESHLHGVKISQKDYKEISKKYQEPSLFSKISNLSFSLTNDLKNNFSTRSRESVDEILKICDECVFFRKDKIICVKCGCYLTYKAKFSQLHCPIDKW